MMYHYLIFGHRTWDLGRMFSRTPAGIGFSLICSLRCILSLEIESGFPNFVKYALLCINSGFQVIIFKNKTTILSPVLTIYNSAFQVIILKNKTTILSPVLTIYNSAFQVIIFKNKTTILSPVLTIYNSANSKTHQLYRLLLFLSNHHFKD